MGLPMRPASRLHLLEDARAALGAEHRLEADERALA
jgi:hypothetical protein